MSEYYKHCAAEVAWYRQHGKHSDRIRRAATGEEYVVGDWSWNRKHTDRHEVIEPRMWRERVNKQAAGVAGR